MNQPQSSQKISETLLRFGQEFLDELPVDYTQEEIEACMKLVITVWNAVTLDAWEGGMANQTMLRNQLANEPPEMFTMIERLIGRKHQYFGSDLRGVGHHWFKYRDGQYVFGCDARAKPDSDQHRDDETMH